MTETPEIAPAQKSGDLLADQLSGQFKALRLSRNLTQAALGLAVGMKQARISALETTGIQRANLRTLFRLARFFDVALTVQFDNGWQMIGTAPKDGRLIWLLTKGYTIDYGEHNGGKIYHPPRCAIGKWNPEGDSWVDENGLLGTDDVCQLAVTGIWESGGGWFQPNEVTHWMPLPAPPSTPTAPTPEGDPR